MLFISHWLQSTVLFSASTDLPAVIAIVVSRADSASEHIGEQLLELGDWTEHTDDTCPDADGGGTYYRTDGFELRTFDDLHIYLDRPDAAFDDHEFLGQRRLEVGSDAFGGREGDVSPREVRRATAAYYGMIETVDEYFGEVLDALEEAGEDIDEWIVVFTSDHGEMLGQHGVWEKGHFFEGSARVPLVVRWPERFDPGVVRENVNLCDLFATICDLTETPLPEAPSLDSRSLVPLLEGRSGDWLDDHENETVSAYGDDVMIKRDDMKYVHVEDDTDVLFDLDADPGETENRIADPVYADAVDRFRARRDELGYGANAAPSDVDAGYTPGLSR